jgi:hypothetical protein
MKVLLKSVRKTKRLINCRSTKSEQTTVAQTGERRSFGVAQRTVRIDCGLHMSENGASAFLLRAPPVAQNPWFHSLLQPATQLPNSKLATERRCQCNDVLRHMDTVAGQSYTAPEDCAVLSRGLWSASELHHDHIQLRLQAEAFLGT